MNDTRKPAILVDIDGVICHVPFSGDPATFDWVEFMKADLDRVQLAAGVQLVKCLVEAGLYPVFLTARPEFMRYQTEQMLAEYGLHGECHMASDKSVEHSNTEDYQLHQMIEKDRVITEHKLMERFNFLYGIDDQELNAKLFWAWEIPTLQPRFV